MSLRRAALSAVFLVALAACSKEDGQVRTKGTTSTSSGTAVTTGATTSTSPAPTTSPSVPGRSGVEGTVSAGPTCPVERADQPCPPRPVETDLRLVATQGSLAARARSGADGRFRLEAPPGSYRLEADYPRGPGGGCETVDVVVEAGRYSHADVSCDTGIR